MVRGYLLAWAKFAGMFLISFTKEENMNLGMAVDGVEIPTV